MRVLLLHERFPPDSGGGGEYVALRRCQALLEAGCEVEVICAGKPGPTEVEGVTVRRVGLPRQLSPLLLAQALPAARRADMIHSFTYFAAPAALAAARLARRPAVCEQLALFGPVWHEMSPGLSGRTLALIERAQLKMRFDAHVFLSAASLQLARKLGFRGDGRVVSPGIDLDSIACGPKSDPPVILFAGKFDHRKGLDRFHALAEALPQARFEAVGWPGNLAPRRDLPNLTVTEGRGANYRTMLARASLLFMPSRAETFGLVIPEAMRAGCAIISTVEGDYAGKTLNDYSLKSAIEAVSVRLENRALLVSEGKANFHKASNFNWQKSTQEILAVYQSVLERSGLSA